MILLAAMFVYAARKNFQANARLELADSKRREAEDLGASAQKRSAAASTEAAMARQKAAEAQSAMSAAIDQSEKAKLQMSEAILQRDQAVKLKQAAEKESQLAHNAQVAAEERMRQAVVAKLEADRQRIVAVDATNKARQAEVEALALKEECEKQRDLALKQAQQLREQAEQIQSTNQKLALVVENGSVAARRGEGIDVSHHNGRIDWVNLGKSGVSFAFMKATQGTALVDQTFLTNTKAAQTAGIPTGAYHFFTTADPKAQAELFLNTVGANNDLRPVLAVETPYGGPSWGDSLEGSMRIWLDLVEKKTGCAPIILTSISFAKNIKSPEFGRYPLWIVRYSQTDPVAPPPWTKWTLWQYTDHGNSGTGDGLFVGDLSRLSGSLDDLRCKSKP
jgi:lysozyme